MCTDSFSLKSAFGISVCFRAFLDSAVAEFETLIHAGAVPFAACRAEKYQ